MNVRHVDRRVHIAAISLYMSAKVEHVHFLLHVPRTDVLSTELLYM